MRLITQRPYQRLISPLHSEGTLHQGLEPLCIDGVLRQMTVEVWCAVIPPDWSSLTQSDLGSVHSASGIGHPSACFLSRPDGPSCRHQLVDPVLALSRIQVRP